MVYYYMQILGMESKTSFYDDVYQAHFLLEIISLAVMRF